MYQYKPVIKRIVDGDTIVCDIDLGFNIVLTDRHVRVAHIDAPEKNTPEGKAAIRYLEYMLTPVTENGFTKYKPEIVLDIMQHKADKYGRLLAEVTIDGRRLDKSMVEDGHARPYEGGNKSLTRPPTP